MIELENITMLEYFDLEIKGDYDLAISYASEKSPFGKSVDTFKTGGLWDKYFDDVRNFQAEAHAGLNWHDLIKWISVFSGISTQDIAKYRIVEFHQGKNYLFEELSTINEVESKMLGHQPINEEVQAGIERFEQFGHYGQLLKLAGGDPLKVDEVKKMRYEDAFLFLAYDKTTYDFQEELANIRTRRMKNNH